MNVSENIPTSTPSVSSISLTGRAAPESPEDVVLDDERAGPGSETDTRRSHKSFYFAGAISCIIVVTLIGAVLAILLTNKPPVQDAAPKNSFLLTFIGEDPEVPLARCEGDCDTDEDCFLGLVCYQGEEGGRVPGCGGDPATDKVDYCIRPEDAPSTKLSTELSDSPSVRSSVWPQDSDSVRPPTANLTMAPTELTNTSPPNLTTISPTYIPTDIPSAKLSGIKASLDTSIELVKDAYGGQVPPWKDAETNKEMRESGQFKAVQWCADNNVFKLEGTLPLTLFSLASFFYGSGGVVKSDDNDPDVWSDSEGWLDIKKGHCNWSGIKCLNETIEISVGDNKLKGTLAPEIFMIPHLTEIWLKTNTLSGTIPSSVGLAKDLEWLVLENNKFSGSIPDELYNLPKIQQIWLAQNEITGNISPKLSQLTTIELFGVMENLMSGTLHSEMFSSLTNLVEFDVDYNGFDGPLPAELFDLPNLEYLWFNYNEFTGTIPNTFSKLKKLVYFYAEGNKLSGTIPEDIGECISLQDLNIGANGLISGSIPESLYNLRDLRRLYISDNDMTGTLSNRIGEVYLLDHLGIFGNNFEGTLPVSLGNLTNSIEVRVHKNSFSGTIPEEFGLLERVNKLNFGANSLKGPIPDSIFNLKNLSQFYAFENMLTGSLPINIDYSEVMDTLSLYDNKLDGTIPESLENFPNLVTLRLELNNFDGTVPDIICTDFLTEFWSDCTNLVECSCCSMCCDEGTCTARTTD